MKTSLVAAALLTAACAAPRAALMDVAPPAPAPRNCQASWQEAKLYDTAGLTSAGAAAAVGSLIAGRELTESQRWAAGITAGVLATLAITFGSLKGYSERELERCRADETAEAIGRAREAASAPAK